MRSVAWSRGLTAVADKVLFSASQDETIRMWQLQPSGEGKWYRIVLLWHLNVSLFVFRGHVAAINSVAVQPTGHMICSGSWDRTLRIWATGTYFSSLFVVLIA